jgi:hypothetical protein
MRSPLLVSAVASIALLAPTLVLAASAETDLMDIDTSKFGSSTEIDNPWMPLKPGTRMTYEGYTVDENGKKVPHRIVFAVTDLTKMINGVKTVVIFDNDYSDDELAESELTFFAQDDDGNVWHLGQYSEIYESNELVGGRVWVVGHPAEAKAGIMMKADPKTGTPSYSQGYAPYPFNWTDRGRTAEMGQKTKVPAGSYDNVLVVDEFNQEEPEAIQVKYYAHGVGNVRVGWKGKDQSKETIELTKIEHLDDKGLAEVREGALKLEARALVYGSLAPMEPMKTGE